jgi:hypothetical protein
MDYSYEGFGGGTYGALDNGDNPWGGGGGTQVAQWTPNDMRHDALTAGDHIPSRDYSPNLSQNNLNRESADVAGSIVGKSLGTAVGGFPGGVAGNWIGGYIGETIYGTDWGARMGNTNMIGGPDARDEARGYGGLGEKSGSND